MTFTPDALLTGLLIAVSILLLVVLYHILFIVVDVRRIARRFESLSQEIETVILKPLSLTDKLINLAVGFFEEHAAKKKGK